MNNLLVSFSLFSVLSTTVLVLLFLTFMKYKFQEEMVINPVKLFKYFINFGSFLILPIILLIPSLDNLLWDLSLYSVFILMCIRPLNNLFPNIGFNHLMILRKSLGIFSATIVVLFGFVNYIPLGMGFFTQFFSLAHWSFENNAFSGHLGELTGIILLITSNNKSKMLLKKNWKRIQRLSYIYFFSGAWYTFAKFDKMFGIIAIVIVFELTLLAFFKNGIIKNNISLLGSKLENFTASFFIILLLIGTSLFTGAVLVKIRNDTLMNDSLENSKIVIVSYEQEIKEIKIENNNLESEISQVKKGIFGGNKNG